MSRLLVGALLGVLAAVLFVSAAPAAAPGESSEESGEDLVVYDQRQNGSENLRVSLSDVMLVVAPVESVMAAASDALNTATMGAVSAALLDKLKTPDCSSAAGGRCKSASQSRSRLRLSHLLQPFINRVHHHR